MQKETKKSIFHAGAIMVGVLLVALGLAIWSCVG